MNYVDIRLDDQKYRRPRLCVLQRGATLQQAVEAALAEASASIPEIDFRGFLQDTDAMEAMERDRQQELARERRLL